MVGKVEVSWVREVFAGWRVVSSWKPCKRTGHPSPRVHKDSSKSCAAAKQRHGRATEEASVALAQQVGCLPAVAMLIVKRF